jgi:hypothetical protein
VHKLGRKSTRTKKELLDIATTHRRSGYDGEIFDHRRLKAKCVKEPDGGSRAWPDKIKKDKKRHN